MDEVLMTWWTRAREEVAVLDLRLSLELDEARHELGGLARTCWGVVERELLQRPSPD